MSATRLAEINEQLQVLFRQKDQIDAQIIKLNKESDKIREKDWNERTDYTIADLLNGAPNSAKRQRELLRDVLLPYHLRAQGYYAETLQTGISVTMFRDDSDLIVREVAAGLDMLLDWMKPIDKHRFDIDGPVIVFDIFEHTLSEGGSFNLVYGVKDRIWHICRNRWVMDMAATTIRILETVRQKNYYQENRPADFVKVLAQTY